LGRMSLGIPRLGPGSPGFGKLGLGISRLRLTQPELGEDKPLGSPGLARPVQALRARPGQITALVSIRLGTPRLGPGSPGFGKPSLGIPRRRLAQPRLWEPKAWDPKARPRQPRLWKAKPRDPNAEARPAQPAKQNELGTITFWGSVGSVESSRGMGWKTR
jgi:hypothetical protein